MIKFKSLTNLFKRSPFDEWKRYASSHSEKGLSINEILDGFFSTVDDGKTYTTRISKNDLSGGYDGYSVKDGTNSNKYDDNANLACIPSTSFKKNVDDYQSIKGFLWLDCNYKIDEITLEPVITAVEGLENGVNYTPYDYTFVGVVTATYYRRIVQTDEYDLFQYSFGRRTKDFIPNCASIRVDGTIRNWTVRAKWLLNWRDDRMVLYNGKGNLPVSGDASSKKNLRDNRRFAFSYNRGNTYMQRIYGPQYGIDSYETIAYAEDMSIWKYGVLGLTPIMTGCCKYQYCFTAVASELNTRRIIVPTKSANNLLVGSWVIIGIDYAIWNEQFREVYRYPYNLVWNANTYCINDACQIESIEDLGNGASAINIALDSDNTFNTVAGETIISTIHWETGHTDSVLGKNDGTPIDNTNGKEPFRLQGIEYMNGLWEVAGDLKARVRTFDGEIQYWKTCTTDQRYYSSHRESYDDTANCGEMMTKTIIDFDEVPEGADGNCSSNIRYIWRPIQNEIFFEGGFAPTEAGLKVDQRYRAGVYDVFWYNSEYDWREVLSLGSLRSDFRAGIPYVFLGYGTRDTGRFIGCRPSAASSNHGNFIQENA